LVVLFANAFTTRRQLAVQVQSEKWVSHTRSVLLQISETESLLKDAETAQRGFLYTGDPKYLEPYNNSVIKAEPALQKLTELTADNPHQQARIVELRRLTRRKLSELAQTIDLSRSGKTSEAKAIVLSDFGKETMDKIRATFAEMIGEEVTLENQRSATYHRSVDRTIEAIYLTNAFAACGLILLAWYTLREMSLREKHAAEIKAREEWFRITLGSIGDGVIATDDKGIVTFFNPIAEQLTGRDAKECKGHPIEEVFPIFNEYTGQRTVNPVEKVVSLGITVGLANHTVLQHMNGTLIPIEDSAAPIRDDKNQLIGVVLVFRDATHERRSHEILRKTEKLAAAARLAATVAHEINNPLEAVGNLIYLSRETEQVSPRAAEYLTQAEQELERVSHITRQTLGFYRESTTPVEFELSSLVDSVLKIYDNKFKTKNIRVERDFVQNGPMKGLAGELKQLISNLISNSADAVGNNGTIKLKIQPVDGVDIPGVRFTIEDDGVGISPEHLKKIFEPFFTTKKDVGTGLGLWVAKEIVSRHGGNIEVSSLGTSSERGAIFTVFLPNESDIDTTGLSSQAAEAV
jgi:PAS domain S-box-containing protein